MSNLVAFASLSNVYCTLVSSDIGPATSDKSRFVSQPGLILWYKQNRCDVRTKWTGWPHAARHACQSVSQL